MEKTHKQIIDDQLFTQSMRGEPTIKVLRAYHDLNHDRYIVFEQCPDQPCDAVNVNKVPGKK